MRTVEQERLDSLDVGDQVVIMSPDFGGEALRLGKVTKRTRTQIGVDRDQRFRAETGSAVAAYSNLYIRVPTDEQLAAVREREAEERRRRDEQQRYREEREALESDPAWKLARAVVANTADDLMKLGHDRLLQIAEWMNEAGLLVGDDELLAKAKATLKSEKQNPVPSGLVSPRGGKLAVEELEQ